MKNSKNLVKVLLATLGLFAVVGIFLFVYFTNLKPASLGKKKITIEVIIPDEEVQKFAITTNAETLRQALEEENLIKGQSGAYGYFITEVNGRKADDSKQEWWCITKGGETVYTGVDQTNIQDGDKYELTLMEGY